MLKALLGLLFLQNIIGFHCAQTDNPYLITQETGTAHISVPLPGPFIGIILDETEFGYVDDECQPINPGSEPIPCSLTTEGNVSTVKAEIANVEDRRVLLLIFKGGSGEIALTVYFSQGGKWTHINSQSIRPQFSSPGAIYAKGKSEVDVTCARDLAMGEEVALVDKKHQLICTEQEVNQCSIKDEGPNRLLTTTIQRPKDEDLTILFCTNNSLLSFAIFWASDPPTTTSHGTVIAHIFVLLLTLTVFTWH